MSFHLQEEWKLPHKFFSKLFSFSGCMHIQTVCLQNKESTIFLGKGELSHDSSHPSKLRPPPLTGPLIDVNKDSEVCPGNSKTLFIESITFTMWQLIFLSLFPPRTTLLLRTVRYREGRVKARGGGKEGPKPPLIEVSNKVYSSSQISPPREQS